MRVLLIAAVLLASLGTEAAQASGPQPFDVAVGNGRAYVAEYGADRVAIRDLSGTLIRYIGGRGSAAGQMIAPTSLALGNGDRLYVTDSGNARVDVFSPAGDFLFSFGHFSLSVDPSTFATPLAIATNPHTGYVYVADKHMIQVFTPQGRFVRRWGQSRFEDYLKPSWIDLIDALAIDSHNRVYAADRYDHWIKVFSPTGKLLAKWGPKLSSWELDRPSGLAIGPDGVYVSDALYHLASHSGNEKVLHLGWDGGLLSMWGATCQSCSPGFNSADPGALYSPQGLDIAGDRVYVTEAGNQRVQVFTLAGDFIATWPS